MAFLLAPCVIFLWAAGYAVLYGTDYANTPQEDYRGRTSPQGCWAKKIFEQLPERV